MKHPGLGGVSQPQLEHLLGLVRGAQLGAPLTPTALQAHGLGALWDKLSWLAGLERAGLEAVLAVAIDERVTRPGPRLELVWTGPEAKVSAARDTAVVVRDLFSRAQRSVIVASFSFTQGHEIFEELHIAMRDRAVEARIFLHIDDRPGVAPEAAARDGADAFLHANWPFSGKPPELYFDPRTVAAGSSINLHAKCVVVDDRWALVGSANFTHNALARNIEVGVLVDDPSFAQALTQQWHGLIDNNLVQRIE